MSETHPGASPFTDRHGKVRWRFRRKGKTTPLPGAPGEAAFEVAYSALIAGRPIPKPKIIPHPRAVLPQTMGAAWQKAIRSPEWMAYDPATKTKNTKLAELFLASKIGDSDMLWRDAPVADLRRRHIKEILATYASTPHKAKHLLVTIRKMIRAALDEEWIDIDPSHSITHRPEYVGWKAWPDEARAKFEAHWPIGSTPRLIYALALWLGNRRGDVANLKWAHLEARTVSLDGGHRVVRGFSFAQKKGGEKRAVFLPITPMLQECLDAVTDRKETVAVTAYGRAYSDKSLTGMMAHWTRMAGLGPGHTLHGLRKTLGRMLAEGDATTRQLMEALGHDDIEHAELYSREAEKARLATQAMDKVVRFVGRKTTG